MNRRNFLKLLGIGTATAAAAPALLPLLKAAPKPPNYVSVRLPPRYADISFTTADVHLGLEDFEERVMRPAMEKLAERLDGHICNELCVHDSHVRLATRYKMNNDLLPMRADMAYLFKQQGAW